jgi:hypothetical protein
MRNTLKSLFWHPLNRYFVVDFTVYSKFTYGKQVNKTFKGTEKAVDLLQADRERAAEFWELSLNFSLVP